MTITLSQALTARPVQPIEGQGDLFAEENDMLIDPPCDCGADEDPDQATFCTCAERRAEAARYARELDDEYPGLREGEER
jgi:hypothetical protein